MGGREKVLLNSASVIFTNKYFTFS
jgi:hypothetical protein